MRKRVNLGVFARIPINMAETCEGVLAVNVHGTRAADTLSAGAPESEGGVDFILDLDERVEHLRIRKRTCQSVKATRRADTCHRTSLVKVDRVRLESGFRVWLIWILGDIRVKASVGVEEEN